MQLWSRPAATLPIMLNEQAIINNLTDDNVTRMWPNRRAGEDERLYLVHDQGTAGINTPYPLLVKKFQNVNPALQVDGNVRYRYNSEMFLLASNSHANIIKVVDLIQREDAIMLVYEYPVNGSLDYWLHRPVETCPPLGWPERRAIAIGVAKGLCHLHHGCNKPIVHHNISSDNILLDQNFKAVIASFGDAQMNMAGLGQPLPVTDLPPGNFGYAAPEYGRATNLLATWAQKKCNELMANNLKMFKIAVDKGIPDQARYMKEIHEGDGDHVQAGRGLHRQGSAGKAFNAEGSGTTLPWAFSIPWPPHLLITMRSPEISQRSSRFFPLD